MAEGVWIPDEDPRYTNASLYHSYAKHLFPSLMRYNLEITELVPESVSATSIDSVAGEHVMIVSAFRHGYSTENKAMSNKTGDELHALELRMMREASFVDAHLVQEGIDKARALSPLLEKIDQAVLAHPIQVAFTSVISRALETVWYATEQLRQKKQLKIHVQEGLRETLVSRCSERRWKGDIQAQEPTKAFFADMDFSEILDGPDPLYSQESIWEEPQAVASRILHWLAAFTARVYDEKITNVVLSSHSWILFALLNSAFECYVPGSATAQRAEVQWANTELRTFKFKISPKTASADAVFA
eukprot:TRINITY_DN24307_c0_g1_i1.p1 TRINITY_DN24307_c0_g1~~TRINITY_DN24307_c0_g1_i1.p1  ORF type:complete len:327 (+),score=49.24 TRINITY_DN24307_c0_g1_i1:78-983(+)